MSKIRNKIRRKIPFDLFSKAENVSTSSAELRTILRLRDVVVSRVCEKTLVLKLLLYL